MSTTKNYKLYGGNPEFTRNIWQEFTLQRLLMVPIILFLLLMLVKYSAGDKHFAKSLMSGSVSAFVIVSFLWGSKLISDTLVQEFTDGTWDSQRISGLTAIQLVVGKLFGGTIIVWYTSLFLLGAFIYAGLVQDEISSIFMLKTILGLVCSTIIVHGFLMCSLLASWKKQAQRSIKNIRFALIIPFLCIAAFYFGFSIFIEFTEYWNDPISVVWFGWECDITTILLIIAVFLACWVLIGAWQLMRSELQFSTKPWWWLGFLVFWMIFLAGFVNEKLTIQSLVKNQWMAYIIVCLLCVLSSVYFQMFFATKNSMYWLRFSGALKRKDFKAIGNFFPAWLTSYIVALMLAVVLIAMQLMQESYHEAYIATALMLFVLRDVLLAIWLNLSKDNKRADGAWIFYLAVLYMILPGLMRVATPESAQFLFYPGVFSILIGEPYPAWFILSPLVQVILMIVLVKLRWRKITMVNAV